MQSLGLYYFFVAGRRPNDCVAIVWYVDGIIKLGLMNEIGQTLCSMYCLLHLT